MSQLIQGKNQTSVGILVVDNQGRFVSLNRKFIEIWRFPKHLIVSRDENQALEFASEQCEQPKSFLQDIREIYNLKSQMDLEIHDILRFKDGRVLERHFKPQWFEEEYVGRIWIFREVMQLQEE